MGQSDPLRRLRGLEPRLVRRLELSDFKRDVCRAYGTLLEEQFFSRRSYFVVDRRGVLRWSHAESELGQKRANTELIKELENL